MDKQDPKEPINIIAHSQGVAITIAALNLLHEKGHTYSEIRVGSLVLMGSPLNGSMAPPRSSGAEQNHDFITNAASMIYGNMMWYYSEGDEVSTLKGSSNSGEAIGHYGLDTSRFDRTNIQAIMKPNVSHTGKTGWWAGKWLGKNELSELISPIHNVPIAITGGIFDVRNAARDWAGNYGKSPTPYKFDIP